MPQDGSVRRGSRGVVAALLSLGLAVAGGGCGKKEGASPQDTLRTPPGTAAGSASPALPGQGEIVTSAGGGFAVVVAPSVPSRIAPPSVSVKSPPGQGAEILAVTWLVNGAEAGSGQVMDPLRFRRGDRIQANVALRAGGMEKSLGTPEVVAVNALPSVTDVRIEPQAPTAGGTVRAVVQAQEPDGDPLSFRYQWSVDDIAIAGSGESFSLKNVQRGSWIHVTATPNDGFADGAWKASPRYQVVNAPPVVRSAAPTMIPPTRMLRHTIVAEDPDGDPLTYSLSKGPPGMVLEGTTLEWQVPEESIGRNVEAVVTISDGVGGQTVQNFSMTIRKD